MPTGLINFIGSFEKLPTMSTTGDVCVHEGNIYIWNEGWQVLVNNFPENESYIQNGCLYLNI